MSIWLFQTIKSERSAEGPAQIYFGQKYFSLKSAFDPFLTQKMERSAGGSAQIYFGQKYLSLKSVFDLSKLRPKNNL